MELKLKITAQNAVKQGISGAKAAFQKFGAGVKSVGAGIAGTFRLMKKAAVGLGVAILAMGATVREAFQFETATVQFKILLGSMDKAKERIKELQDFSASTPFQFGDIAQASRSLEVFTGGAMGAAQSLGVVGDAAAATGNNISEVAFWTGRAYSAISNGKPFGEAAARLQEMGILSGEARNKMEDLQKAGASNAEIWTVLQGEMGKYEGGMKDLSETGDGLTSTLKDNWKLNMALFGEQLQDLAKNKIKDLITWMQKIREDGTLEKWAVGAAKAISNVGKAAVKTKNFIVEFGGFIDTLIGGEGMKGVNDKKFAEGLAFIDSGQGPKDAAAKAEAEKASAIKVVEDKKAAEEKVMEDLAKKQKALDEKNLAELQKKKEELNKKLGAEQAKEGIAALNGLMKNVEARIATLKPQAEQKVQDWMAQQAEAAAEKEAQQAFDDRVTKVREKRDRLGGRGKLSKKDAEFLANVEAAEAAKKKAADALKQAEKERKIAEEKIKKLQEKQLSAQEKIKEQIIMLNQKLAPLLAMK